MNNIEWKDGVVCYINGRQRNHESIWINGVFDDEVGIDDFDDFQLNEIRTGDFIPASELDTEQKYNEVVEVFGLFGHGLHMCNSVFSRYKTMNFTVTAGGCCYSRHGKRQLTYNQIIAIGKLKRMMLERERSKGGYVDEIPDNTSEFDAIVSSKSVDVDEYFSDRVGTAKALNIEINGKSVKPKRRNKSKQAYDILKSLDYEYDLVKQKWYRKEWVK